jgi:hypothetical protein
MDTKEVALEILAAMGSTTPGAKLDWGPAGNKARAIYLAARMGHHFDPKCSSCEGDLLAVVRYASKPRVQ